uniref:Pi-Hexatoxin-Hc1a_1 n=1 Tax=Hadronyche cerberea TaxID=1107879 RepID=A0A4Q8K2G4_HADCE
MKFPSFEVMLLLVWSLTLYAVGDAEYEDLWENASDAKSSNAFVEAIQVKNHGKRNECIRKWLSCVDRKNDCCEGLECYKRRHSFEVCVPISGFCLVKWKQCDGRERDCCAGLECWKRRGNKSSVCAPIT